MRIFIMLIIKLLASNIEVVSLPLSHNCSDSWPELELFVPVNLQRSLSPLETRAMADKRSDEFEKIFIRSFLLFWPLQVSNTSLRVLVDAEVAIIPILFIL